MKRPRMPAAGGPSSNVIIIGGGSTGALTAVELVSCGLSVTLLEKAAIGNGSSSRSAACIRAQWENPETVLDMMYSLWYYHPKNFYDLLDVPKGERNQPILTQNGYLFLYEHPGNDTDDMLKLWEKKCKNAVMQQELGLPVEILDSEEVSRRWPHILRDSIIGATWHAGDGFLNHDLIYNAGIACLRGRGGTVLTNTEVTGANHGANRTITSLQTTAGEFSCDWVINATNAWAPRISTLLGGTQLRIDPVKRFLYEAELRSGGLSKRCPELPMTIFGLTPGRAQYCRPQGTRMMYGWAHDADPEPTFRDSDQDVIPDKFSPSYIEEDGHFIRLISSVNDFSPDLANTGRPQATCGYYGQTPDIHPFIDVDPRVPNLVHAAGFSGHGLMMAPCTALLVKAIVTNSASFKRRVELPVAYPGSDKHSLSLKPFAINRDFGNREGQYL